MTAKWREEKRGAVAEVGNLRLQVRRTIFGDYAPRLFVRHMRRSANSEVALPETVRGIWSTRKTLGEAQQLCVRAAQLAQTQLFALVIKNAGKE